MKRTLLILVITGLFMACTKKDTTTTPSTPKSSVQQDPTLIGVWMRDSTRNSGTTTHDSATNVLYDRDTLYIASSYYYESMWDINSGIPQSIPYITYTWQTTTQDSVIASNSSSQSREAYNYNVSGKILLLQTMLLTQSSTPPYTKTMQLWQYWYHKIK